jgi:ABC-type transport system substrate-binding protein/DNA-binding SARP family transcriptional activator/DNA-binding beta-propeller fold protein YncE
VHLRLLGPLEVRFEDGPVELGPRKQRAVLAMLALEPGRTVSGDRLAEGLWGDELPASAPKMVQLYVSRLRRVLDGDGVRIVTHGRGYELQLADEESVDAVRFERLLGTSPRDALALWRGEALADLTDEPFAAAEIRRLEELRLRAIELAIDSDLAAGRHAEVIAELDALVVQEPLRERLRAQRMLALYRSGRQADALEAYRDAREALLDLGIEPSAELHALHQAMLEHDPQIAAPAAAAASEDGGAPTVPDRPRRTTLPRRGLLIAAGALIAVAAGVALLMPDGDPKAAAVRSNSVAEIDLGDGSLHGQAALDGPPSAIAIAPGAIWVAGDRDGTVSRIDPKTHTVRTTIPVGHGQSTLAADRGGVWVANRDDGTLTRISSATNAPADHVRASSPADICLLGGGLWIAGATAGAVLRVDTETHKPRTFPLGGSPTALACGAGGVWAVAAGQLMHIDPETGLVRRAGDVGPGVSALAVADERTVWVANPLTGIVSRVDPKRGVVTRTYTFGADDEPVALAVSGGDVWVANRRARTVARIDPERTVGTEEFRLGHDPRALAVVDGRLWVAVAATGPGQRGGTLRVDFQGEADAFVPEDYDPATAYTPWGWQVVTATSDGLTTYRRVGGLAGATLLPNLAESLPAPSDGGRTYAFTLRRGVRFSTGRTVRPSDVKRGIERALHTAPRAGGLLDGIASMAADDAGMTLVFRLKRADPDFLYRLAVPFASAVPPGTPAPPTTVVGTGPYRIAGYEPGRSIRLERNRFFRPWSALARPDGYPDVIDARLAVGAKEAIAAVRGGRRDVAIMGTGLDELARLRRRDPGPIRDAVDAATTWIFLNTRVPPFDDADARRALSLAIDRRPVIAAAGGADAVRPACHIIPPGLPGYRSSCPTGGPDLAGARRLVARSGTRGARVTLWTAPGWEPITPMLTRTLRSLGYRTSVRRLGFDPYFRRVADSDTRSQIGPSTWGSDYPSTSTFLDQFACRSFSPHDRTNPNLSQFCDPRADDLIRRATAVQTTDPRAADVLWARAERQILAGVPVIPVLYPLHTDLVSTRVRNDQYHPQWGLLLDQVSVR